jgi:hypothetical protein
VLNFTKGAAFYVDLEPFTISATVHHESHSFLSSVRFQMNGYKNCIIKMIKTLNAEKRTKEIMLRVREGLQTKKRGL